MLKTKWTAPGEGETAETLLRWIGRQTSSHGVDLRETQTALLIVETGPPEEYDVTRAVEALRVAGVEVA